MAISCYIVIQIVSEKIYFLKGSLFKTGEAKIRCASCVLLRVLTHAQSVGSSILSFSLLCQVGSVLSSPELPLQIKGPWYESSFPVKKNRELGPHGQYSAHPTLGQLALFRGLVMAAVHMRVPWRKVRMMGSFMFDFWRQLEGRQERGRLVVNSPGSTVIEKINSTSQMFKCVILGLSDPI